MNARHYFDVSNAAYCNSVLTRTLKNWLYLLIFVHIFMWTLAPIGMRYTLPMDAMEGTTWGQQYEWGYDKNPYMNAWLTSLALKLGPSGWAIYLFSQLSVGASFWAVWQLAKKMVSPLYAFISVLVLASIQYFNLHAIDFNDNTLELSFWSLTTLFFYEALQKNTYRNWLLVGFFAGCGLMTKYYTVMLLLPMFFFMLLFSRRLFLTLPPYVGLLLCLILSFPHFIWLFSHEFVTVNYAFRRISTEEITWLNHIYYPAHFFWDQVQVFIPALALLLLLCIGQGRNVSKFTAKSPDFLFLIIVGTGPFILTLLLSFLAGIQLRAGWGQPLLTWWPLIFLMWVKPNLTLKSLNRFYVALLIVVAGMWIGYCVALNQAKEPSSANYPGKKIALTLEDEWHKLYSKPLAYVVGQRWLAGNIAFYSKDHPKVYIEANPTLSPWIDESDLKKKGALFIWDPDKSFAIPYQELKKRFPRLTRLTTLDFNWLRNKSMSPVQIGVAFLPPEAV